MSNQMEKLQISTTNTNVAMKIVIKVILLEADFLVMSKMFMKEFLMIVTNVIKVSVTDAISILMWKLFIWIWRISNVMNVINLLDKRHILKGTFQLSIEMRRNSVVINVANVLEKNIPVIGTLEMSTKSKKCDFCRKTFWYVICQHMTTWNFLVNETKQKKNNAILSE